MFFYNHVCMHLDVYFGVPRLLFGVLKLIIGLIFSGAVNNMDFLTV